MDPRKSVLVTLAYFDVFDIPLKTGEVLRYLIIPVEERGKTNQPSDFNPTLLVIQKELDQLVLENLVFTDGVHYFLFDRQYLVPLRFRKEKFARKKWRLAIKAAKWLRLVPYLRGVFASGSLALDNTEELSDLDFLIVAKNGRIWLARFLVTGLLSLLRFRRRGTDKIAPDKICLNHYLSDGSLKMAFQSIYTAQLYNCLTPLYLKEDDLVEKFRKTNDWVLKYFRVWPEISGKKLVGRGLATQIAGFFELTLDFFGGGWVENFARNYQSRRITQNPQTGQPDGRIIFNDDQLEFHPRTIETKIVAKYNENLQRLGLNLSAKEKDSLTP